VRPNPWRAIEDNGSFRYAFRELAQRYHPDRVGPGGIPFLRNIIEAYHVLSDYERAKKLLWMAVREFFGVAQPQITVFLHSGPTKRYSALLSRLPLAFFMTADNLAFPRTCAREAVDVQLTLTPEEAAAGGTTMIYAPAYYPCSMCRGSGQHEASPCSICDESGLIAECESVRITIPCNG
jgi:molecular chaperone DnaJ